MNMRITNFGGGHTGWPHGPWQRQRRPPPGEPEKGHAAGRPAETGEAGPHRSEQYRAVIGGMNQAIQGSERAIAILQCARDGLGAVAEELERLRGLIAAGPAPPADCADRVAGALERIDALATGTRFGEQRLLDGSLAGSGEARGPGLQFLGASPEARSSPPEGYAVGIGRAPARPGLTGEVPLAKVLRRGAVDLRLAAAGREARYRAEPGEDAALALAGLRRAVSGAGLPLEVELDAEGRLRVRHLRYGSGHRFVADSVPPGVLSRRDGTAREAAHGRDVAGTLHGEPARGEGERLTGEAGNRFTAGLTVAYTGPDPSGPTDGDEGGPAAPPEAEVGRVTLVQRGLTFRFGAAEGDTVTLQLPSVRPTDLGADAGAAGHGGSLAAVGRLDPARRADAEAALAVVERATTEVYVQRRSVERLLYERLLPGLQALRVQTANLTASRQAIPDPGHAVALARRLTDWMLHESGTAAQAQAHPVPGAVLKLISGRSMGRA